MGAATRVFQSAGLGMFIMLGACMLGDPGTDTDSAPAARIMPFGKAKSKQAFAAPFLRYRGGPVIPNVKVQALYWGNGVVGTQNIESFYSYITQSPHIDWLSEYNTPTQAIGRGSFVGGVVDPAPPGGRFVDDSQIRAEVLKRINDGTLQPNDENTMYMVHFPPGYRISMGGSQSCSSFCAYHSSLNRAGQRVYYAVMPDLGGACAGGCGGGTQAQNTTSVSAHELIEAVTDPDVGGGNLGWYDNAYGEIGDICNAEQGVINGFTVQKEWSNEKNACIVAKAAVPPPPPPAPPTALQNGVAVTGLGAPAGTFTVYTLDVPAGASNLKFSLSGGTGDADLYVKYAAAPSKGSYDYRPYLDGNNESVTPVTIQAGKWYVAVNAYSTFAGAQLVASYSTGTTPPPDPTPPPPTPPTPPPPPTPPTPPPPAPGNVLTNNVPVTGLAGPAGSQTSFTFEVPAGKSRVKFNMSGGTGDADIYVKYGAAPTLTSFDFRPYGEGNWEGVDAFSRAGTWYVMIHGSSAYSGVSVVANWQ